MAPAARGEVSPRRQSWLLRGLLSVLLIGVVVFGWKLPALRQRKFWSGWKMGNKLLPGAGLGKGNGGADGGASSTPTPAWKVARNKARKADPVPDIVHFIFGLDPTFGHLKFGMIHYLAVLGAAYHIKPSAIQLHHMYVPDADNPWWQCAVPHLKLVKEPDVTTVWGKPFKMKVQHKADIVRMRIMREEGGIYLDSDVIALRPFTDLRRLNLSMGLEGSDGLCNAVMVGAPNTSFINRWWDEYKDFNPETQWAYHSVLVPRRLAREHPDEITVLSERAFFWPMWIHLKAMYDIDDGYDYHDNYAVHLWTSADERQRNRLAALSPDTIWEGRGSFHRLMRLFLKETLEAGELCDHAAKDVRRLIAADDAAAAANRSSVAVSGSGASGGKGAVR